MVFIHTLSVGEQRELWVKTVVVVFVLTVQVLKLTNKGKEKMNPVIDN